MIKYEVGKTYEINGKKYKCFCLTSEMLADTNASILNKRGYYTLTIKCNGSTFHEYAILGYK